MGKAPVKGETHLDVTLDENGKQVEVIYDPPLLATFGNIRVELRKEKNHDRPHIHIMKTAKSGKTNDVSIALDDFECLAGHENLKSFDRREYQAVMEFLAEKQDQLIEVYKKLKGDV